MAKALDRPKKEQKLFANRAMNYKNVFDKESLLMRGRNKDGHLQKETVGIIPGLFSMIRKV